MRIIIKINTRGLASHDNDRSSLNYEIERLVKQAGEDIRRGGNTNSGDLHDTNGKVVGSWEKITTPSEDL